MSLFPIFLILVVGAVSLLTFLKTRSRTNPDILDATDVHLLPKISTEEDKPIPFGYKQSWLAVKTTDHKALLKELGVTNFTFCNWISGLHHARKGYHFFITPPIKGWLLIVSDLVYSTDIKSLLERLSHRFEAAQGFATDRRSEYHFWAKADHGKILRYCSYSYEEGIVMEGEPTITEKSIDDLAQILKIPVDQLQDYIESEAEFWPHEGDVLQIAGVWSINPSKMKDYEITGLGVLARDPSI